MQFFKRGSYFLLVLCLLLVVICGSISSYADNYPLEAGEKLVEERVIDDTHAEIFTQLNSQYYLKELKKENNLWNIVGTKIITLRPTGLNTSETQRQSDRDLVSGLQAKARSFGIEAASLPPVVDYSNSKYLPPVGEQQESSCVGWSTGYYLRTFQEARDLGWQVKQGDSGIKSHIFSPSFIYNQINGGKDEGAFILDAAKLLQNIGDVTLDEFPYIPKDYYTKPSQAVIASAYPHRIREWKRLYCKVDTTDQDIILRAREYLNTGDLIVAGSDIGLEFYYPYFDSKGNSIITIDSYAPYQHAFVIVGYDDSFVSPDGTGAFKIVSSWGTEWGNQGFSYISYKAFTTNALEGYVFTDLTNNPPQDLTVDVCNSVIFNMDFSGSGQYNIKIADDKGTLVYKQDALQGKEGINVFKWNGTSQDGTATADGTYKLSVTPYEGNTAKEPFTCTFQKSAKIKSASSHANIYDSAVQSVDVPIDFNSDGKVNINVEYDGKEYPVLMNQTVKAGESQTYQIQKDQFDFNGKDLALIVIKIEIQ